MQFRDQLSCQEIYLEVGIPIYYCLIKHHLEAERSHSFFGSRHVFWRNHPVNSNRCQGQCQWNIYFLLLKTLCPAFFPTKGDVKEFTKNPTRMKPITLALLFLICFDSLPGKLNLLPDCLCQLVYFSRFTQTIYQP